MTAVPGSTLCVVQRRTVGILSGGVALAGLGVTVGVTVGGLLARDVAGPTPPPGWGRRPASSVRR